MELFSKYGKKMQIAFLVISRYVVLETAVSVSTRDQFYAVLILVLRGKVLVLILMVLVLKGQSRKVSKPAVYVAV